VRRWEGRRSSATRWTVGSLGVDVLSLVERSGCECFSCHREAVENGLDCERSFVFRL
jgi:hypothetical protein